MYFIKKKLILCCSWTRKRALLNTWAIKKAPIKSAILIDCNQFVYLIIKYLFPMQHIYTIDWKRFSLLIGTTRIFTMTRKILTNSLCWKSAFSIYVFYRAFLAHFQVSVDAKLKWFIFSFLPHLRSKWFLMKRYDF